MVNVHGRLTQQYGNNTVSVCKIRGQNDGLKKLPPGICSGILQWRELHFCYQGNNSFSSWGQSARQSCWDKIWVYQLHSACPNSSRWHFCKNPTNLSSPTLNITDHWHHKTPQKQMIHVDPKWWNLTTPKCTDEQITQKHENGSNRCNLCSDSVHELAWKHVSEVLAFSSAVEKFETWLSLLTNTDKGRQRKLVYLYEACNKNG